MGSCFQYIDNVDIKRFSRERHTRKLDLPSDSRSEICGVRFFLKSSSAFEAVSRLAACSLPSKSNVGAPSCLKISQIFAQISRAIFGVKYFSGGCVPGGDFEITLCVVNFEGDSIPPCNS